MAIRSWRDEQVYLLAYFRYPPDIRRVICIASAIESVHRQFRKLTKTKSAFSSDNALTEAFVRFDQERREEMDHAHKELGHDPVPTRHLLQR